MSEGRFSSNSTVTIGLLAAMVAAVSGVLVKVHGFFLDDAMWKQRTTLAIEALNTKIDNGGDWVRYQNMETWIDDLEEKNPDLDVPRLLRWRE